MLKPKRQIKRSYFAFPYIFLAIIFTVIPLLILLYNSFLGSDGSLTFDNFVNFFTRENVFSVMITSIWVAFVTTLVCLAISYPLALILANSKFNKSMILVLMFILPMYVNSLLRTYAIKSVFDMIGLDDSFWRLVIALAYDFFPFMLLPIYTTLCNIDKSYFEASADLGGGSLATFKRVTLPLSIPGVISGILMVFMPTISSFSIRDIVVDSTDWYLFGNLIYDTTYKSMDYGLGSAYSFILLAMIMISMVVANKLSSSKSVGGG